MLRALAVILVACGLGLLLAVVARSSTEVISLEVKFAKGFTRSLRVLEGVWAPRDVYMVVVAEGCRVDAVLYSGGRVLGEWRNSSGFITRVSLRRREYSYLQLAGPGAECKVRVNAQFYGLERDLLTHSVTLVIAGVLLYAAHRVWRRRALTMLALLLTSLYPGEAVCAPPWLKPGAYARYRLPKVFYVILVNGTIIWGPWSGNFSWTCINVSGELATLLVNLTLSSHNATILWRGYVRLNTETREVYYGGERLGITALYIWPPPQEGGEVELLEYRGRMILGDALETRVIDTWCCGPQRAVVVNGSCPLTIGKLRGKVDIMYAYDLETGLLMDSLPQLDPLTLCAGVVLTFPDFAFLEDANIDLGPPDFATLLKYMLIKLLFALLIASPLIIAAYIILRRRRSGTLNRAVDS